jgi:hypothetical protein
MLMWQFWPLLAQALEPLDPPPHLRDRPSRIFGLTIRDALLIIGAGIVLALILFLWAYLTRKDRRHRSESGSRVIMRADKRSHHESGLKRRRRRRRDPFEGHRNPTLGETGGLPPLRPEEPTEPTQ